MRIKRSITYFILVSTVFLSCGTNGKKKEERPNILFFLVDDQRNDVLSSEGHPIVKTPTVDNLARNGVKFTNAFVTTSICAASRASILTGLYETRHNFTFGKDPIKTNLRPNPIRICLKNQATVQGL